MSLYSDKILILDYGSQYTQLIARRVRENKVYSEIYPCTAPIEKIKEFKPKGIILSGGPASVYDKGAPLCDKELFELGTPILGICYGMQLMTHMLGGKVARAVKREYGHAELMIDDDSDLFKGIVRKGQGAGFPLLRSNAMGRGKGQEIKTVVWMSHGDRIEKAPRGFISIAHTKNSSISAMKGRKNLFGLQFHPEVTHTPKGMEIIKNFIFNICKCKPTWTVASFIEHSIREIKKRVGDRKVICALSGGVDSTVTAMLVNKAVDHRLTCVFVNNGLLRKDEAEKVVAILKNKLKLDLIYTDVTHEFLGKLKGVTDPEKKRKIIGEEFIYTFEEEARKIGDVDFLAQGTLYPDVIESVSFKGPSAKIKTHHNVGGLPTHMKFFLLEPLRELFKDEVRMLGKELGLPDDIIWRQPFPGPGLAVRILGEVTEGRLEILRDADAIVEEEIRKAGFYKDVWQSFAVLLPVKTVGVMGDERTYENVIALRAVTSLDGMTADWVRLPFDVLGAISSRIINEVRGVNRVVYDISTKPPSTIEWE